MKTALSLFRARLPGRGRGKEQETVRVEGKWRRRITRSALLLSLLLLAGSATIIVSDLSVTPRPELPELEFPPVVVNPSRTVSKQEAMDLLASMLNLTAWAEETSQRAAEGKGFYKAMLVGPGTECGKRPAGELPRTAEEVMNCTRAELERRADGTPEWNSLLLNHKAAAAAQALEQTWRSKSPEVMLQTRTAYLRGQYIDREDPEFREFAELFDLCLEDAYNQAGNIIRATSEQTAGAAYNDAAVSMEQCASAQIARRFPKPAPETPPDDGPAPNGLQPDAAGGP